MLSWICELKSTKMKSQSHSNPERLLLEGQSARMSDTLGRLFDPTIGPIVPLVCQPNHECICCINITSLLNASIPVFFARVRRRR
jgi:hypothetical protein